MKKLNIGLLSVALILTGMEYTNVEVVAENSDTQQSTTVVEIEPGGEEVNPIIDGIKPETNHKGPLVIDAVSNFNFGKIKLGISNNNALLENGETLGVQVSDTRGTGGGWSLTASISDFSNADSTKKLKAELTIPVGKIKSNSSNLLNPAVAAGATLNESPSKILYAQKDSGMGTWSNSFEGNSQKVNLVIPTDSYIDSYSAIINWSLQDAPT